MPINSSKDDFSFFMNEDGLSGYFASNRDGGVGSDDIYAYNRTPQLKIEGVVTNAETNMPIENATVTLFDTANNPVATVQTDVNGNYDITIDRDADYTLNVKKDAYLDSSVPVTSKNIAKNVTSISKNVAINPEKNTVTPITELEPIYFDFNKYDIRHDSTVELDRIVSLMKTTYPNMVIKIESHTDSRGSTAYNHALSEERAKATYEYLINKGVNPSRITAYKGFGEQKLTNGCDGSIPCTEAQHQLNRRTQFIVIKME
jgi:outer membrane protein OmpA-like peptidoglycan-associated protein